MANNELLGSVLIVKAEVYRMDAIKLFCFFVYLPLLLLPLIAQAENALDKLTVMALAPLEGRAVVKGPDGTLHVIQRGDVIRGTAATLLQVLPDKLVVQDRATQSDGTPDNHVVWMYKVPAGGGYSRIVRLQSTAPVPPLMRSMMTMPISTP